METPKRPHGRPRQFTAAEAQARRREAGRKYRERERLELYGSTALRPPGRPPLSQEEYDKRKEARRKARMLKYYGGVIEVPPGVRDPLHWYPSRDADLAAGGVIEVPPGVRDPLHWYPGRDDPVQ